MNRASLVFHMVWWFGRSSMRPRRSREQHRREQAAITRLAKEEVARARARRAHAQPADRAWRASA